MSVTKSVTNSAARMLDISDVPISRIDIDLADPDADRVFADGIRQTRKTLALVRLHTHPVGVVVLDSALGRSWRDHAAAVWALVGGTVNAHLRSDGIPEVDGVEDLTTLDSTARCRRARADVLAGAKFVSIVVATRDRSASLRTCLDALLRLHYPRFEIVVVDNDPSTDETARLVASYDDSVVRYFRENRRGLASAHNCGLAAARGSIVAFVDDDVVVDRHWVTAIAEGFAAGTDVGCVTGLILPAELETPGQLLLEKHGGFDKGFTQRVFDLGPNRPPDPLFPFTAGKFGSGANMAFDSEVLRRLGGFDPAIGAGTYARGGDDLAAFSRVVIGGHQLVYQPSAVVWHRHHREMSALRNQAYGYGVGLGAYLTSLLVHEPRMCISLLGSLRQGLKYTFGASSERNRGRYDGLPADLARREKRGLLFGPAAYAVSRWRSRAVPATTAGL